MEKQLILTFDGSIIREKTISIRALGYTLPHFQRAIDKTVTFSQSGQLTKFSTLKKKDYGLADLYLGDFEEGSLKIPLIGELLDGVGDKLAHFLKEPYAKACAKTEYPRTSLTQQIEDKKSRLSSGAINEVTYHKISNQSERLEHNFAQASILNDISTMTSPLSTYDDSIISITTLSPKNSQNFIFDEHIASNFRKIVRNKRILDPIIYTGFLAGLVEQSKSSKFGYQGRFINAESKKEMTLHITSLEDATALNSHNLSSKSIKIFASPIAVYESFDHLRGDIVFIGFAE